MEQIDMIELNTMMEKRVDGILQEIQAGKHYHSVKRKKSMTYLRFIHKNNKLHQRKVAKKQVS